MTITEAETGAAERHEFRWFKRFDRERNYGVCWCGWKTPPFWEDVTVRSVHAVHQHDETVVRRG
jgi:hypothetical protein